MLRWFADNSELNGIYNADIPDILIFGGIVVYQKEQIEISNILKEIKSEYHKPPNFPIKWNLKSLKRVFENKEQDETYLRLLNESKDWRKKLFQQINGIDYKIIIACVESHSKKREVQLRTRDYLIGYTFADALMRFGYHVRENSPAGAEIILDWPEGGNRCPYDNEYEHAFYFGSTIEKIEYYCGPLEKLNFIEYPLYSNMNNCPPLQISDLIVGACREFIEVSIGKKEEAFGSELMPLIVNHFRGYPNNIMGRGLSADNTDLYEKIKIRFEKIVGLI